MLPIDVCDVCTVVTLLRLRFVPTGVGYPRVGTEEEGVAPCSCAQRLQSPGFGACKRWTAFKALAGDAPWRAAVGQERTFHDYYS